MRSIILLFCAFLPGLVKKFIYRRFFGWDIHRSASIGFSFILSKKLIMEENSSIASLTVIKGISMLHLSESSFLGSLNWITGFPLGNKSLHFFNEKDRYPALYIKRHAAITSRHIIDCTSTVVIGDFSTFAGFRSQILTHSIDLAKSIQSSKPVTIGEYCFIGTNCILLPGAKVPNKSILAASSVVVKDDLVHEGFLYGGVPAKAIKKINPDEIKYMNRLEGFVW